MSVQLKNKLRQLRVVGILEGVSFLVLLGISMPLKYLFDFPEAVKYNGWAHGILFVAYLLFAFQVFTDARKPISWLVKAVIAAFLPFGTFVLDKQLKREEAAL